MAWWHNEDGSVGKPFKSRFDPSHAWPILPVLLYVAYIAIRKVIE